MPRTKINNLIGESSLQFSGSTSFATNSYPIGATSFSIAGWVKISKITNNDRIIDCQDAGPVNGFAVVIVSASGANTMQFNIASGAANVASINSGHIKLDRWYHIVGTYEVNSVKFYVDGVQVGATDTSATMGDPAATFTLGKRATAASNFFGGSLAQVLFYERVLSSDEVVDLYRGHNIPAGYKFFYNFTTKTDLSGNGYTLTTTNPYWSHELPYAPRKKLFSLGNTPPFSIAYYPVYRQATVAPSTINWNAYSHIFYFSTGVTATGGLDDTFNGITATLREALVRTVRTSGRKVSICIGGSGESDADWAASTSTFLTTFIANIVSYVKTYEFDGVDLDWEPATRNDLVDVYGTNFENFVIALRKALPDKLISIATPGSDELSVMFKKLEPYVDLFNVMSYDMNFGLDQSWHNSPLFSGHFKSADEQLPSADKSVQQLLNAGISRSKIGIGGAYYGYQLNGPNTIHDTTAITSRSTPRHREITTAGFKRDPETMSPYVEGAGSSVIVYEDGVALARKINYVRERGLGAMMIFEATQEDEATYPLSTALANMLASF